MASGFVEVSGYSATDMAESRAAGYQDCIDDLEEITITENGTYDAEDMGVVGWKKINAQLEPKLMSKTITANGFYDAGDDDHVDGYSSLEVAVPGGGGGGPFTVRFFADDRQTILKTDANVPYGGSASCTELDGTEINGLYFKGWNPAPTNVTENMNCYPVRGEYIIDQSEIQDSWETICAVNGAGYPIGSYKALVLTNEFDFVHRYYGSDGETYQDVTHTGNITVAMHMVKVAEGEDGTTSTWLSTGVYPFGSVSSGNTWLPFDQLDILADWGNSGRRVELNEGLFANLPACLRETIKEVNKSYIAPYPLLKTASSRSKVVKTSLDKIWIPSIAELKSFCCTRFAAGYPWQTFYGFVNGAPSARMNSDAEALQNFDSYYGDEHAIDYAANYVPSYTNFSFRDIQDLYGISAGYSAFHGIVNGGSVVNYHQASLQSSPFGFCL